MIREYKKSDSKYLHQMLEDEGWTEDKKLYEIFPTYILEEGKKVIGFMTLKEAHKLPAIIHFCIHKDKRDGQRWKQFLQKGQQIMKEQGTKAALIMAPKERPYLKTFIEHNFKLQPYAEDVKGWYYILEVK